MLPFDLHVLSIPPAFNLSQDQTLQLLTGYIIVAKFFEKLSHRNVMPLIFVCFLFLSKRLHKLHGLPNFKRTFCLSLTASLFFRIPLGHLSLTARLFYLNLTGCQPPDFKLFFRCSCQRRVAILLLSVSLSTLFFRFVFRNFRCLLAVKITEAVRRYSTQLAFYVNNLFEFNCNYISLLAYLYLTY